MLWLKRNLFLVVGGLIALGLLGVAGFFLYSNYQKDAEVTGQLSAKTDELKTLTERDPYPDDKNITLAKKEQERAQIFLKQAQKYLGSAPPSGKLDNAAFKALLENTIFELKKKAENAGVGLPPNYGFTFQAQRPLVQFAAGSLEPLASQLADIKAICNVAFDAKIHSIEGIRRVAVSADDTAAGGTDYIGKSVYTNAEVQAVVSPYELKFHGFTTELADTLAGLARAPHCFIVKSVFVESTAAAAERESAGTTSGESSMAARYGLPMPSAPTTTASSAAAQQAELMKRYGITPGRGGGRGGEGRMSPGGGAMNLQSRYGLGPRMPMPVTPVPTPAAPSVAAAPSGPKGPVTIIEEKPLQITISLDVVKLLAAK